MLGGFLGDGRAFLSLGVVAIGLAVVDFAFVLLGTLVLVGWALGALRRPIVWSFAFEAGVAGARASSVVAGGALATVLLRRGSRAVAAARTSRRTVASATFPPVAIAAFDAVATAVITTTSSVVAVVASVPTVASGAAAAAVRRASTVFTLVVARSSAVSGRVAARVTASSALARSRSRSATRPAIPGEVANPVAVVALGIRVTSAWGAAGFARVVAIAALAPLDADFEALHVEAVKLGQGLLGRLLGVVLNERVRSLVAFDVAAAESLEFVFQFKRLDMLGNVSNEQAHGVSV